MVTNPISATLSRRLWNFGSEAQVYLESFPQLEVGGLWIRRHSSPAALPTAQLALAPLASLHFGAKVYLGSGGADGQRWARSIESDR
jgi:hypothetical protein